MITDEAIAFVAQLEHKDAPEFFDKLATRLGVTCVKECALSLDADPNAEDEWKFLTFEEMEEEEKRVGALNWIIPNVLPEGGLVYVSAPPSGGKTWAVLELIRALTTGTKWMDFFEVPKTGVVMVDEEMGVKKILPRFRKLGIKPSPGEFAYSNKAGVLMDDPADILKILARCQEMGAKVVIVDTLTRVHGMDENDNSQMKRLFKSFQPLLDNGITLVMLHHDKKGGVADGQAAHERMRGASEIAASADMSFSVDKHSSFFRMKTTKGRLSAEQDDICVDFAVLDNEDRTQTSVRVVTTEEKTQRVVSDMEERVLDKITENGPLSQTELVEVVEGKRAVVIEAANRLVQDRKLVTERDGKKIIYRLPETVAEL